MYDKFLLLITNRFLLAAVLSWLICQTLKFIIGCIKAGRFDLRKLVSSGGMPSAHTAVFVAPVVMFWCGSIEKDSPILVMMVLAAIIVTYDSVHVRRQCGEHSKVINRILQKYKDDDDIKEIKRFKEEGGHTVAQVVVGAIVGAVVGFLL